MGFIDAMNRSPIRPLVLLVAYASVWPILFNTIYGVREVDRRLVHDERRLDRPLLSVPQSVEGVSQRVDGVQTQIDALQPFLKQAGISYEHFKLIVDNAGVSLFDQYGRMIPAAMEQFATGS